MTCPKHIMLSDSHLLTKITLFTIYALLNLLYHIIFISQLIYFLLQRK